MLHAFYKDIYGSAPSNTTLRILKHDLMQQIWLMLLNKDFMDAYKHGMVVMCRDGKLRRLFPHIMYYIADYPEKSASLITFTMRDANISYSYMPPLMQ